MSVRKRHCDMLARVDDRCHVVNYWLIKGHRGRWARMRLFRSLRRIERPLCDRVSLADHVEPPRSRVDRRTRSNDDDA